MTTAQWPRERFCDKLKRAIDLAGAIVGLAVTAPLQLVVALLVRRHLGRPVLFRQRRPGLHGEPFVLLKFRTMTTADPERAMVPDAERLTPFGVRLRRTSLDELPTLWNVLRGDMSFVGPRPLLLQYMSRYSPQQARRHEVRPGITGLAQISGRNALTWEQKFDADIDYVDHRSFRLDARILAMTVQAVLRREGISAEGEATMPEFIGIAQPMVDPP